MYTAEVTDNDIEEMLNLVATINNQIKYKSIHCVTKGEFYRIKKHLLTWYMLSHPQNCEFLCMQKPLFGKSKFAKLVVTTPKGKQLKLHCESSNILESSFIEMRTKETCPLDNENSECETDNLDSNWQLLRSKCESLKWFFLSGL